MEKLCTQLILFISVIYITGCASGTLKVNSSPDKAEVLLAFEGEQPNKIGETPLNLDSKLIDGSRGKYLTLFLKKNGYQTESVMVPASMMKSSLDVSARLDEYKLPQQCIDQTASVEKIARGIASVQTQIKKNNYAEAQNNLSILINEFPNVSVLHDLMGNVHYMNKNLDGALASYEKSLGIDPNNSDTQRVVGKIRSIIGVRSPASAGGQ